MLISRTILSLLLPFSILAQRIYVESVILNSKGNGVPNPAETTTTLTHLTPKVMGSINRASSIPTGGRSTTAFLVESSTYLGDNPVGTDEIFKRADPEEPEDPEDDPLEASLDDTVDTIAYQFNVYAADLASGEYQTIVKGDSQQPPIVIPLCPNHSNGTVAKGSQGGKRTYGCDPPEIGIDVHFHYVTATTASNRSVILMVDRVAKNVSCPSNQVILN